MKLTAARYEQQTDDEVQASEDFNNYMTNQQYESQTKSQGQQMFDTLAYLDDSKMINSSDDLLTMSEEERDQLVSPLQNDFAPSHEDFMWSSGEYQPDNQPNLYEEDEETIDQYDSGYTGFEPEVASLSFRPTRPNFSRNLPLS